ncbi:alpha/beta hydrolase fold protein [Xylariomycetidae sp. FL2044]|nr:alpha/beta hydrolase fold protein [Xylariomycetidae sp. FL2044]
MEAKNFVNPIHPSLVSRLDQFYMDIYNETQAPFAREDQVPYGLYHLYPAAYTRPTHITTGRAMEVKSNLIYTIISASENDPRCQVQVYVPTDNDANAGGLREGGLLPAVVHFHGGGFVLGDLSTDEVFCRHLCHKLGCIVINVAYRKAPRFPHPIPVLDGWYALKWVFDRAGHFGIDPTRVAVSGREAGGCIAAVVAILARDEPTLPRLALQLLIAPITDARYVPKEGSIDDIKNLYESYAEYEHAPSLPLARLSWFYNLWLGKGPSRSMHASSWLASPIVATSHANLAPASIRCAEIDPLFDEGFAYSLKLFMKGTMATFAYYRGQGHSFTEWTDGNFESRNLLSHCVDDLRKAFRRGRTLQT